ncbi:MAG: DUF1858 domain-containing protein [Clostridiales bacterium]|nr:DUF1858 domain-containing protein [Clostridiales bacterium]MCD8238533.1 DUF1858 domain-containing protein [Clostridiales bacterium]
MKQIDKNTIIADILKIDRGAVPILMMSGMHCIGCPASQGETLEEACLVHGIEPDPVVEQLNSYFATLG